MKFVLFLFIYAIDVRLKKRKLLQFPLVGNYME